MDVRIERLIFCDIFYFSALFAASTKCALAVPHQNWRYDYIADMGRIRVHKQ